VQIEEYQELQAKIDKYNGIVVNAKARKDALKDVISNILKKHGVNSVKELEAKLPEYENALGAMESKAKAWLEDTQSKLNLLDELMAKV